MSERYMQVSGNIASNMDGEKVMMSVSSGKYYNLGQIGGRIWELVESPATLEELVSQLTAEYEITVEECTSQVKTFLAELEAERLVQIVA